MVLIENTSKIINDFLPFPPVIYFMAASYNEVGRRIKAVKLGSTPEL
jgi:hypothetical protein